MSADNRTVATDALATLGTIIGPEEKRDAIHLAVIPVQAKSRVYAGDHVNSEGQPVAQYTEDAIGIVDPFLSRGVDRGEWFWLVIYPRKITSLRHVWSHPAFPDEPPVAELPVREAPSHTEEIDYFVKKSHEGQYMSGRTLRKLEEFAARYGTTAENLLEQAERIVSSPHDESARIHLGEEIDYNEQETFWPLWEDYTGRKAPASVVTRPFSCSC